MTLPSRTFLPPPSWAILECTLVTSHNFTVEWRTPSGLIVTSPTDTNRLYTIQSRITNNVTQLTLKITGLSYLDEGRYDCIVEQALSTTLQEEAQLELLSRFTSIVQIHLEAACSDSRMLKSQIWYRP